MQPALAHTLGYDPASPNDPSSGAPMSTPVERRKNLSLRELVDKAYLIIEPFFDPANAWNGQSLEHLAYRVVRENLPDILLESVKTTAIVMLLICTSMGLSWVMAYANIPQSVSEALIGLAKSPIVILLVINLILLAVGTFMDMTPAVLIFTPIFLPIVSEIGMDPTHFGIVMVLNLCVGLCTPPVGSVLFIGCSVADVPITRVVRPLLPLFAAMIVSLLAVTYLPWLSLWLPGVFGY